MKHGWRCWWRGWEYTELSPRGAWLVRVCRRCGKREKSILGILWRIR